jgi:hypothetical protein
MSSFTGKSSMTGVSTITNVATGIVSSGLVLHLDAGNAASYPGTGTVWTDLSGNGNNGTLVNGPTYSSANGGTIVFDGTNDKVDCGNAASLQITVGTISAWINATSDNSGYNGIITKQFAWGLFVRDNLLVTYDWGSGGGDRNTGVTVGNNTWKYVAMSFTQTIGTPSNNAIIYINGSPVLTTRVKHENQNIQVTTDGNSSQCMAGNISQIAIYNRVLSAAEITENYNALRGRYGL